MISIQFINFEVNLNFKSDRGLLLFIKILPFRQATRPGFGVFLMKYMPAIPESEMIQRLKKGDKAAMEVFYDRYSPVLLAVCLRYLPSREDAEDTLHESLLKVLRGLDKFNPRFSGSFEVWMRRIAANTALNCLRRNTRHQPLNGWEEGGLYGMPDDLEEGEELPEELDPELVIRLIGELPDGYRTVLNLYVFEDYTHKEIAKTLGISENTSKSQLSKARALLRKKVNAHIYQKQTVKR